MRDGVGVASRLLGEIEWVSGVEGYCRCPGEVSHRTRAGRKDCRIRLDGVPTLFCFHSHCEGAVEKANRELRQELGREEWSIRLPDGRVIGNVELSQWKARVPRARRGEVEMAKRIEGMMGEQLGDVLEEHEWTYDDIIEEARGRVPKDALGMFQAWLSLWPMEAIVWIGEKTDSGRPEHAARFRTPSEWGSAASGGVIPGPLSTGASFVAGSWSRCLESVERYCFVVVESDELSRDEVGAVFRWMRKKLGYRLRCIVDTGGKSLHAWFDCPPKAHLWQLRAALRGLRCDAKTVSAAQAVRVPGVVRAETGRLQAMVWR